MSTYFTRHLYALKQSQANVVKESLNSRKTKRGIKKCVCACVGGKTKINRKSPRDHELVMEVNVRFPLVLQRRCQENLAFFTGGEKLAKKDKIKPGSWDESRRAASVLLFCVLTVYPTSMYFHFLRSCKKHKLTFLSTTVFTYIPNKVVLNKKKKSINSFLWQKNRKDGRYVLFSKNTTVQLRYLTEKYKLP